MSHQKAVIGIDIGSTNIKGVLLSEDYSLLAADKVGTKYLNLREKNPSRREFHPNNFYESICSLIRKLLNTATLISPNIAGISINAASGNTVLLDRNKKPIADAISWMDRRASGDIQEILPEIDTGSIHQIVGWPWRESFTFAELAWLRKHRSKLYTRAKYPCMYIEYLIHRLSGKWEIDTSNATLSFLQDQEKRQWYPPYCSMVDIDPESRPVIRRTGEIIGSLNSEFIEECGLQKGVKLVHGSFDHPGAALSSGVTTEGEILLSCGTSWVAFYPISKRNISISLGLLTLPFHTDRGPAWASLSSMSRIGVVVERYIDLLGRGKNGKKYSRFNYLSSQSFPGANGLYLNLMDERENEEINSEVFSQYSQEDIARAVMEGVTFELYSNIKKIEEWGKAPKRIVLVGGPAESDIWPQIIADITGMNIEIQEGQFAGANGAALVAGHTLGIFDEKMESNNRAKARLISPDKRNHLDYKEIYDHYMES